MNTEAFIDIILLIFVLLALSFGVRLYSLLRTGELGRSWQFIVWGVILLVLREILRLGNQLSPIPNFLLFEKVCEAGFAILLCYALWRQWSAFNFLHTRRKKKMQWDKFAKSIASFTEQQVSETKESEAEKEWREQWYRKV